MSEMILRACGHATPFIPRGDKWDEARRLKAQSNRCPACTMEAVREHNAKQAATAKSMVKKIKKGHEIKQLPVGTNIVLTRQTDGSWAGVLTTTGGEPRLVEATMGGAMGLINKLSRRWLAAKGQPIQGAAK